MSFRGKIFKILIPVVILLAGVGLMAAMIKSREAPKKETRTDPGVLVRAVMVEKEDRRVDVAGTGTVQAARVLTVIPQVSGRVVRAAPGLVAGGFFNSGELLFEIEDSDYRLEVQRAESARVRAEYELARIESQARVARKEWERLGNGSDDKPNPLVLYEPQLKDARAALASAEAALGQARLDLERTRVFAPFDCLVRSEDIEPGQFVSSGRAVMVLTGTERAEIVVPLPLDELRWVEVPRVNDGRGSAATVVLRTGGTEHIWQGHLVRSLGEVDPGARMMHVVISIEDPYALRPKAPVNPLRPPRPPLAVGSFVEVVIEGRKVSGVYSIPRTALREDSTVWTVDSEERLLIKKVKPLRVERDEVLVSEGLSAGDRVVTTSIAGAANGMRLRPVMENAVGGDGAGGAGGGGGAVR